MSPEKAYIISPNPYRTNPPEASRVVNGAGYLSSTLGQTSDRLYELTQQDFVEGRLKVRPEESITETLPTKNVQSNTLNPEEPLT